MTPSSALHAQVQRLLERMKLLVALHEAAEDPQGRERIEEEFAQVMGAAEITQSIYEAAWKEEDRRQARRQRQPPDQL